MGPVAVVEYIRRNPRTGAVGGSLLLLVGLVVILMESVGGGRSVSAGSAFYTTEEGATLFADAADLLPPFDHDGKEAVRAVVFSCDNGQHRWVQYLFKYSPEAMAEAARMKAAGVNHISLGSDSALVKRPGDKAWARASDSPSITTPRSPDGQPGPPLEVQP